MKNQEKLLKIFSTILNMKKLQILLILKEFLQKS